MLVVYFEVSTIPSLINHYTVNKIGPIKVGRLSAFITEKKYILNWI